MTGLWLCLAILAGEPEPLTRVLYVLEVTEGGDSYSAKMVLNQLDEQRFSLACRKTPGGTLFTYWATPEQDVLWFPHSKAAFSGEAGAAFRLLPGGPKLKRAKWLKLLSQQPVETIGRFRFWRAGDWYILSDPKNAVTIRWRELKRQTRDRYSHKVLEPRFGEDTQVRDMTALGQFWSGHDGG